MKTPLNKMIKKRRPKHQKFKGYPIMKKIVMLEIQLASKIFWLYANTQQNLTVVRGQKHSDTRQTQASIGKIRSQ